MKVFAQLLFSSSIDSTWTYLPAFRQCKNTDALWSPPPQTLGTVHGPPSHVQQKLYLASIFLSLTGNKHDLILPELQLYFTENNSTNKRKECKSIEKV
ncbi:hypothetical protein Peur_074249 [Populus x canadensis]